MIPKVFEPLELYYIVLCVQMTKNMEMNLLLKVNLRDVLTHNSNFSLLSAEYNGRPTCAAYSGTSNSGSPSIQVVLDG